MNTSAWPLPPHKQCVTEVGTHTSTAGLNKNNYTKYDPLNLILIILWALKIIVNVMFLFFNLRTPVSLLFSFTVCKSSRGPHV